MWKAILLTTLHTFYVLVRISLTRGKQLHDRTIQVRVTNIKGLTLIIKTSIA
jgi:hypothetical protein